MVELGILKADDVSPDLVQEFGEYPGMFANLLRQVEPELQYRTYEIQRGEFPASLDEVDAYLLTGSKYSVYDEVSWIKDLADFVLALHRARKKLVGICFGHQMVAHALGGRTELSEKGWGIGAHEWHFTEAGSAYATGGHSFCLLVSHRDQVTALAPGSKVLAGSDFCPYALCAIEEHILTLQAHPEFSKPYLRYLMAGRKALYGEQLYAEAVQSLSKPTDHLRTARWIVDFVGAQ